MYGVKYLSSIILDVHVIPKLMPKFSDSWYLSWRTFSATCPSETEAITDKANRGHTCDSVSCISMEFPLLCFNYSTNIFTGMITLNRSPFKLIRDALSSLYSLQHVICGKTKFQALYCIVLYCILLYCIVLYIILYSWLFKIENRKKRT